MSIASIDSAGLGAIDSAGLAGPVRLATKHRISLQSTVVVLLLIEVTLFLLSAIAPSFYLASLNLLAYTNEQLEMELKAAGFGVVVYLVAARLFPVYSPSHILDTGLNIKRLVLVLVATFSSLVAVAAATKSTHIYSRLWFHSWALSATELIIFARLCVLIQIKRKLQRGAYVFRALSLGIEAPPLSKDQLRLHTNNRTHTIRSGVLTTTNELESLSETIRTEDIDQIFISAPWSIIPTLTSQITKLRFLAVDIFLCCNDERLQGEVLEVQQLGDGLAIQTGFRPIAGWDSWAKRCEDIIISCLGLAIMWPVMAITAIAIKLESRGPILFRQAREGLNGIHFELLKFRSMYADQTDLHAVQQTGKNDLRVTRIGRLIRRLSIDELPQLLNVLEGSMSIVGPRPHALRTSAEGKELEDVVDYYASRHRVKSGITGLAQVNGFRGELDSVEKLKARVHHDLYYIENWSLWFDLKIIVWTVAHLVFDRKAY
jgi:polysaccharide biosynthesis protein PslA